MRLPLILFDIIRSSNFGLSADFLCLRLLTSDPVRPSHLQTFIDDRLAAGEATLVLTTLGEDRVVTRVDIVLPVSQYISLQALFCHCGRVTHSHHGQR